MKRIATVGTFDGMHRGHLKVIDTLRNCASRYAMLPLAITFSRHPLATIAPDRAPKMIIPAHKKREFLTAEGVETLMLDFNSNMASMTARDWLKDLRDNHNVGAIVIGYDNTFGCDGRSMCHQDYIDLAAELGLTCIAADEVAGVSSSAVRRDILAGNLHEAAEKLGHPFTIEGVVVEGNHIGHTIGFPTANIRPDNGSAQILPPPGVYAGYVILDEEIPGKQPEQLPAVCNIGYRPTIDPALQEKEPRIEANILDFNRDIYGRHLQLQLILRLREERKFPDLHALKKQIGHDSQEARNLLLKNNI